MADEAEEERKGSESEGSAGGQHSMEEESDEEDSNMIPDEKPDGAIGDTTAHEQDLLEQINMLESQEKNLGEEVAQKEALLDKIKQ